VPQEGRGETVLVRIGYGTLHETKRDARPDIIADDVLAAAELIVSFVRS
jgi:hypothetical protein